MARFELLTSTIFVVAACGGAQPAAETPGTSAVVLSASAPPTGYQKLKELKVVSGRGCGVFGERGSPEGALARIRDEAAKLGASYVQLGKAEPGSVLQRLDPIQTHIPVPRSRIPLPSHSGAARIWEGQARAGRRPSTPGGGHPSKRNGGSEEPPFQWS